MLIIFFFITILSNTYFNSYKNVIRFFLDIKMFNFLVCINNYIFVLA